MSQILERLQAPLHLGDRLGNRAGSPVAPERGHLVDRIEERFGGFWAFCSCGAHSQRVDRSVAARWTCPVGDGLRENAIAAAHLSRCEYEAQAADPGAAEMRVANAAMFVVRGFRIR